MTTTLENNPTTTAGVVGGASRADRPTSFDLADMPVPSGREEDWRFTPIKELADFFVPEKYSREQEAQVLAPAGVTVEKVERGDQRLGSVLEPGDRTAVVAWNQFRQSTVVTIPKLAEITEPIWVKVASNSNDLAAQHVFIDSGEQSSATVVLLHSGAAQLNQTVEINTGSAATLNVIAVHEWNEDAKHTSSHRVMVGRDANVTHLVLTLGGDLVRICLDVDFAGPGASFQGNGLYFVDSKEHLEHRVFVAHTKPKCYSRVTYKGALQGKDAHAVWIGDCLISSGAEGTNTYELNRNLVLTEGTKCDSVPNLEIEDGEIEGAGHASATGRFDDEQLFYLMSRGVSELDARRLVVRGFFAELINDIDIPALRDHLMDVIESELTSARAIASFNPET